MRRGLLLYNPAAGRLSARLFVGGLVRLLTSAGWQIDVAETLNASHATQTARRAADEKYETVFAIGGDGTVGQVTAGLLDSETALAVLPAGTANVWARELDMHPFDWNRWWGLEENARLLSTSSAQYVDVGLCNDRPFLLWAGIGLDALAIHRLEPRRRFAKYLSVPHFFATTVWEATFWDGMDLNVWADGDQVEGHYLLAVATNIRRYVGGIAILSPNALLDDGEMDLWLFNGRHLTDAFRHFFDMLAGRLLTSDQARCIPFRSARIKARTPFSVQMDGEPESGALSVELAIRPRALKILMPQHALELLRQPVSS